MPKKNGNGVRETAPGKFVATMYDPRAKGRTRHIGTFTAPPQPNPQFKTRTLARKAAEKAKSDEEQKRDRQLKSTDQETVGEFASRWVRDYPRPQESTNRHNAERIRQVIRDFGDRPLRDGISPIEARAWIFGGIVPKEVRETAKDWDGAITRPGGDVEAKTRKSHHLAVRAMFNDALRDQLTGSNPFASLNVPEAEGRRGTAITVLTEAELAQLVETAHDVLGDYGIHFGALIQTLAWTGIRPGEAWALEIEPKPSTHNWVDWENQELHVRWQIDRFGKRRHTKWDRKGKGRVVYLLPPAVEALQRAKEDRPNGEFFYTSRGLPMNNGTAGYYWDKVRVVFWSKLPEDRRSHITEQDGGPELGKIARDFDLYQLRHFYGTRLAELPNVTPPFIADQMGHKDGGALAMQRYIHPHKDHVKWAVTEGFAELQRKRAVGE